MRYDVGALRILEVIGNRKGHTDRSETLREAVADYIAAHADLLSGRAA